jgi:hypothetical protein
MQNNSYCIECENRVETNTRDSKTGQVFIGNSRLG